MKRIAIFLLLAGCGGGGSNDPGPSPAQTPPANTIDPLVIGDRFVYDLSFQFAADGERLLGTSTITMARAVNNGSVNCLVQEVSGEVLGADGPIQFREKSLIHQSADGSLYHCGKVVSATNENIFVDAPNGISLELQSPLETGQVVSTLTAFTDSTWQDCTSVTESLDTIQVPAGIFAAFRIATVCNLSSGDITRHARWVAPDNFVVRERYEYRGTVTESALR